MKFHHYRKIAPTESEHKLLFKEVALLLRHNLRYNLQLRPNQKLYVQGCISNSPIKPS